MEENLCGKGADEVADFLDIRADLGGVASGDACNSLGDFGCTARLGALG